MDIRKFILKIVYYIKTIIRYILPYIFLIIQIWLIFKMYDWFGGWGLLGMFFIFAAIFLLRTFLVKENKDLFMTGLRTLETTMFGKPLDKKYWKKGELKNLKIRAGWKRKKKKNTLELVSDVEKENF